MMSHQKFNFWIILNHIKPSQTIFEDIELLLEHLLPSKTHFPSLSYQRGGMIQLDCPWPFGIARLKEKWRSNHPWCIPMFFDFTIASLGFDFFQQNSFAGFSKKNIENIRRWHFFLLLFFFGKLEASNLGLWSLEVWNLWVFGTFPWWIQDRKH